MSAIELHSQSHPLSTALLYNYKFQDKTYRSTRNSGKKTKNWKILSEIPHYCSCVGDCDNDSRYPDKIVKCKHVVGELRWHYLPKNSGRRAKWTRQISEGLENFLATDSKVVCTNHFQYRKPTFVSLKPTL